ncbi:MAG: discoidin domain-containing protein, partial [Gammaproteobacteria bacterium]|nr:discoidin domain-containing protein [Gammaproteobacteria bacterium]
RVVHDGETVESYGLAIFGWIGEGGIVENFKVKNATIKGWQRLSFLVGRLDGTIQNVIIDYQSEIVHNSENGVAFTPQYGVIGFIGETGVAKNIDCFAPTGKNGTNDVPLSFLIVESDSTEKCYVGEKYPERIDGINNSVKVEQNKDITLSAVYMNVTYKDGSYGTMNPTSVSEYDKGLLGNQFVTFYIDLPQAIGGRVSYQTIIEVVEVQKVLNATLKSEDTVALIPFNTDNWKYDETDWSQYINLTADGEPIDISLVNILVANNEEDQNVKLVITGTGLTEFRIDVPIKYVIDCKEAIFRLNYHPRGNYVITRNIDCENTEKENFTGGNNSFRFYGTLDGQNHDIYNINISGSGNGIGLINTNHGTVKNLRLYGSVESDSEAGIITPSNYGTIENIYFEGTLNVFRGGIVNYNFKTSSQEGIIRNAVLNVKVVNGNGIAYTNEGTVQNVLVVYDETSTEFELIHNRNKEAVNVNKVDRRLLDINTYSVDSELWSLVKDRNRVIVGGFTLCAIEDGAAESETNQYNIADNDLLSMTWIKGDSIGENAYIQVDLGTLRNVNTLFVSMDSEAYLQQYKLYYAESPQSWILIDEFFSNEVIATINSKVRYIKIERTDDRPSNDTLIKILEIGIDKAENPVSISYKNIEKYEEGEETHVYGHTDLSNIIDKDPTTYCWFKTPEIGASIILDMGSIKELTSFEIDMATENEVLNQSKSDNFFRESKVSISLNGVEWIEIGTYTSKVIYHAFNQFVVARYIKLEYSLNEPNGAEVIIREFAFNLDVLLPSGNIDLNNTIDGELTSVLYTTDGMESTALSYEFEGNRPEQRSFIIDLHEVKEINTINFVSVALWGDRPYDDITYQLSTDGLNYTDESAKVAEISAGEYKIELDTPVEARFIRIIVQDNSKIAISEVSATLSE